MHLGESRDLHTDLGRYDHPEVGSNKITQEVAIERKNLDEKRSNLMI